MPFNRTIPCVAIGLLLSSLCLRASFGDEPSVLSPLFEPADVDTYDGEPEPNEGYFFQYDVLYWAISHASTKPVGTTGSRTVLFGPVTSGAPTPIADCTRTQTSTIDSSGFADEFTIGQRIEFGRIEAGNGFLVGIYQQRDQDQQVFHDNGSIVFNDPQDLLHGWVGNDGISPHMDELPCNVENLEVRNTIDTWSVETVFLHRFDPCCRGGIFELLVGAKYYEFNDNYDVSCGDNGSTSTTWANYMNGSYWNTYAENHIVGPQIGLRWRKTRGRWAFNAEGRFTAGYNFTNFGQQSLLGASIQTSEEYNPSTSGPISSSHTAFKNAFSPIVELRLDAVYKLTSAISFRAGWSGMWVGNVARASNTVEYTYPTMGLNPENCREDVFVTGVNMGIEINR